MSRFRIPPLLPETPKRVTTARQRFAAKFLSRCAPAPGSTCWAWTGARDTKGYGNVRIPKALRSDFGGRTWMKAHLVSLVLIRGVPVDELEHGHHVCEERGESFNAKDCVNPWHCENESEREHNCYHRAVRSARAKGRGRRRRAA